MGFLAFIGSIMKIVLITLILNSLSWYDAYGQSQRTGDVAKVENKAILEGSFETRINSLLSTYLKRGQYSVSVKVDAKADLDGYLELPYAPDSIIADTYKSLPVYDLMNQVNRVDINLGLPDWMDSKSKESLSSLVEKSILSRSPQSEGKLNLRISEFYVRTTAPIEQPASSLDQVQGKNTGNASSSNEELDKKQEEIESLKKQLQDENKRFEEQIASMQGELEKKANESFESLQPKSSYHQFLEFAQEHPLWAAIFVLVLYGLVFLLALVPSKVFAKGVQAFKEASIGTNKSLKGIADSMEHIGTNLGNAPNAPSNGSNLPAGDLAAEKGDASKGNTDNTYEHLKEELQKLRRDYRPEHNTVVAEFVVNLLSNNVTAFQGVLALDVIGKQNADVVFAALSEDQKQKVLELIDNPPNVADRDSFMLDVLAKLNTKLMAKSWKSFVNSNLNTNLRRLIAGFTPDDLLSLTQVLDDQSVQRLFLYLDTKTAGRIINLSSANPNLKSRLVSLAAKMPEALHSNSNDQVLEAKIVEMTQQKTANTYNFYLKHYQQIVENMNDEMKDDVIEQIARENPFVGRYLRNNVITIGTFFMLPKDFRADLLESFTNYELALLVSSFEGDNRTSIVESLDERRRELIDEQVSMLSDENRHVLIGQQNKAREKILKELRKIQATTNLSSVVILSKDDSHPESQVDNVA